MARKAVAKKPATSKPAPSESGIESVFAPLMDLRHRMDHMFDDFMQGLHGTGLRRDPWRLDLFRDFPSLSGLQGNITDVRFDVSESEDAIEIAAELPGLDEKDVELSLSDGVLTIKGEKKTESEEKKKNYYCRERRFGSFLRSFRVPDSVDDAKIQASFDKGVLEVILPKRPEAKAKAKKISIAKKK
ncbi:MAG: Hsp20/alpha crystallin family protein [Kiloniellales bacterium]|nr:Hsp20/alpha crystallin family protein [Kiloniellales bacterium]